MERGWIVKDILLGLLCCLGWENSPSTLSCLSLKWLAVSLCPRAGDIIGAEVLAVERDFARFSSMRYG